MRLAPRRARVAAAIASALALAGCVNTDPDTSKPYNYSNTSSAQAAVLAIRGVQVLSQGRTAMLLGTINNTGTVNDTLVGATIAGATATIDGNATIFPSTSLRLATIALSGGLRGSVTVTAPGARVAPGAVVDVTMSFQKAPSVALEAVVVGGVTSSPSAPASEPPTVPATESPVTPAGSPTPS